MNQQEMTDIVTEELTHIPRGYGVMHGWLRHYYNRYRRRDLAKGKTKEETLAYCVDLIRKENPNWNPEYDITFFKMDHFNSECKQTIKKFVKSLINLIAKH